MKTPRIMALAAAFALSACVTQQQFVDRELASLEEEGPRAQVYKEGYADGCGSALYEFRASLQVDGDRFRRDDARMESDPGYRLGWIDGARRCGARFQGGGGAFIYMPRR